jgi:putative hydrolase of the HAD superfamily
VHPHVEDFLKMLKAEKKEVYLVTNAHYKVLDIKLKKTNIGQYFDRCITSFEIGYPKELLQFWREIEKIIQFDKEKTLFIDDSHEILQTARNFGIKYLLLKTKANSKKMDVPQNDFPVLKNFKELIKPYTISSRI